MSYANPPQGYPPSPDRWPPAGEQGPRHAGGQPPAWTPPQHPQHPQQPQQPQQPSWAQPPSWAPPVQAQPVSPPQLPMRPQWEPAQSPQDWQQAPPPQREVPPPPQRSGFSATYAVLIGVVVLLLGFGAYYLFGRNSGSGFDVKVTKCSASGSVATIGLEVHNRSSDTQTATIRVEYHDDRHRHGAGARHRVG
jgi:hypothetical protein